MLATPPYGECIISTDYFHSTYKRNRHLYQLTLIPACSLHSGLSVVNCQAKVCIVCAVYRQRIFYERWLFQNPQQSRLGRKNPREVETTHNQHQFMVSVYAAIVHEQFIGPLSFQPVYMARFTTQLSGKRATQLLENVQLNAVWERRPCDMATTVTRPHTSRFLPVGTYQELCVLYTYVQPLNSGRMNTGGMQRCSNNSWHLREGPPRQSMQIWAALNIEVVRADDGDVRCEWSSGRMQERGKWQLPEKTRRSAASSGHISPPRADPVDFCRQDTTLGAKHDKLSPRPHLPLNEAGYALVASHALRRSADKHALCAVRSLLRTVWCSQTVLLLCVLCCVAAYWKPAEKTYLSQHRNLPRQVRKNTSTKWTFRSEIRHVISASPVATSSKFGFVTIRIKKFEEDLQQCDKRLEELKTYGDIEDLARYLKKSLHLDSHIQGALLKIQQFNSEEKAFKWEQSSYPLRDKSCSILTRFTHIGGSEDLAVKSRPLTVFTQHFISTEIDEIFRFSTDISALAHHSSKIYLLAGHFRPQTNIFESRRGPPLAPRVRAAPTQGHIRIEGAAAAILDEITTLNDITTASSSIIPPHLSSPLTTSSDVVCYRQPTCFVCCLPSCALECASVVRHLRCRLVMSSPVWGART
ncbi:hypothetical protein PR048_008369 [Dryococelus australis]|uniref:Uncharacterized protein n=1 Tax=Dryococelus australis TaxID=614101 RepID=A0ABQ9HX05_9NEOP|nr:hypothetical protein PR048_008369 [Dryococelus australis]